MKREDMNLWQLTNLYPSSTYKEKDVPDRVKSLIRVKLEDKLMELALKRELEL